jgi:hypothetical protein
VADDYVKRVFEGISTTNPVYAEIIDALAEGAGIKTADDWSWC